jgi:ATP-dependent helicase HrpA
VILKMLSLGLGDVRNFPFLEPPSPKAIKEGVETLVEVGALKKAGKSQITSTVFMIL